MKNKKKLIQTLVLSIVAIVVLVIGGIMINNHYASKNDGQIEIKVIDLNENVVSDKMIDFKKGDTLIYLVDSNFENVDIQSGMIMSIETLTTPSDWSSFICIYVNGAMSNVGISDIQFENNDIISFVMTEFNYGY